VLLDDIYTTGATVCSALNLTKARIPLYGGGCDRNFQKNTLLDLGSERQGFISTEPLTEAFQVLLELDFVPKIFPKNFASGDLTSVLQGSFPEFL
jgi:hypothetical protein